MQQHEEQEVNLGAGGEEMENICPLRDIYNDGDLWPGEGRGEQRYLWTIANKVMPELVQVGCPAGFEGFDVNTCDCLEV